MKPTFTLCFIHHHNRYLMLYRRRPPNQYKWNGVGGKIEQNEQPIYAIQREIEEEAGLQIPCEAIQFRGIVSWDSRHSEGAMYVFIAESDTAEVVASDEGGLAWKSLSWILNSGEAVSNIPLFLPPMLDRAKKPDIHHFIYNAQDQVIKYQISPMKSELILGTSLQKDGGVKHEEAQLAAKRSR
jgi:8-oxo-dGTP diphosphatase